MVLLEMTSAIAAPKRSRKPIAMDLFCGCGGLTTGLKQAGFDVIAAIDIDPLCAATYRENHPSAKTYNEDIRSIDVDQFARELGLRKYKSLIYWRDVLHAKAIPLCGRLTVLWRSMIPVMTSCWSSSGLWRPSDLAP